MDFSKQLRTLAVIAIAGTLTAACHVDPVDTSSGNGGNNSSNGGNNSSNDSTIIRTDSRVGDANPDRGGTDPNAVRSKRYHHFNNNAWDGRGIALVQCNNQSKFDWCKAVAEGNVQNMQLHGNRDKGRWVWTVYSSASISGTVQCKQAGSNTVLEFGPFSRRGSIQYGSC